MSASPCSIRRTGRSGLADRPPHPERHQRQDGGAEQAEHELRGEAGHEPRLRDGRVHRGVAVHGLDVVADHGRALVRYAIVVADPVVHAVVVGARELVRHRAPAGDRRGRGDDPAGPVVHYLDRQRPPLGRDRVGKPRGRRGDGDSGADGTRPRPVEARPARRALRRQCRTVSHASFLSGRRPTTGKAGSSGAPRASPDPATEVPVGVRTPWHRGSGPAEGFPDPPARFGEFPAGQTGLTRQRRRPPPATGRTEDRRTDALPLLAPRVAGRTQSAIYNWKSDPDSRHGGNGNGSAGRAEVRSQRAERRATRGRRLRRLPQEVAASARARRSPAGRPGGGGVRRLRARAARAPGAIEGDAEPEGAGHRCRRTGGGTGVGYRGGLPVGRHATGDLSRRGDRGFGGRTGPASEGAPGWGRSGAPPLPRPAHRHRGPRPRDVVFFMRDRTASRAGAAASCLAGRRGQLFAARTSFQRRTQSVYSVHVELLPSPPPFAHAFSGVCANSTLSMKARSPTW